MTYVLMKNGKYLKYNCARKGWTTDIDEAFKFGGKPYKLLRFVKDSEIVEVMEIKYD